jgi:hypothetical protein
LPSKAVVKKDKGSQPYFLFWNFLPVDVIREKVEQSPVLSMDKRRKLFLFRNSRGSQVDFPGNKGVCRSYASGFQRHQSGTILLKFACRGTPGVADCLIFTKISR